MKTGVPPSRRERKKRDLRERIYRAALELFRAHGYEQTTVQEIADAADVAKGTFFNYFATKEHVLAAYHGRMAEEILAAIEPRTHASSEEAVQDVLRECAEHAVRDPVIARVLLRVMFATDVLLDADRRSEERLQEHLLRQVEDGISRGELRGDLDAGLFVSLLVGTLSASVTEWVTGGLEFDLPDRLRRKLHLLFGAARAAHAQDSRK
jgi:AcrR family transcriptional regulator